MTFSSSSSRSTTDKLAGPFQLPGTSLRVHRMGYGAMQLAGPGVYGPPRDHAGALAVLRAVVEAGVDHIDTSDFYGPHVTNRLLKEALHPYAANLVIVTKVGARRTPDKAWLPAISPSELTQAVHDNLTNLGKDALDVVNYRVMGSGHGLEEGSVAQQIGVLAELQKQGLIRHIGISNATRKQIEEARSMVNLVCVQNHYNLAHREDDAVIDALAKDGIPYVPYFPLGGFSPLQSDALSTVAKQAEATPMQVALAWLLHRSPNILLIPGTSSLGHLEENLAAATLKLTDEMLATLDGIGGSSGTHGAAHA